MAAIESYLSIVCVLVVLGGAMPALRDRLLQRVEAALRSERRPVQAGVA